MASRCINPQCENQSSFFGAGALYAFQERDAAHAKRQREYLWLCASCAAHYAVRTDAARKVVVVPRSQARSIQPRSAGNLCLIFRSKGVPLPLGDSRARARPIASGI
jgi:hypothetical protein